MKFNLWRRFLTYCRADVFSPRGFLLRAGFIGVAFLIVQLGGLREYTSVLNGTVGPSAAGRQLSTFLGLAYLLVYMAFVILAPVLVLAAGILTLCRPQRARESTVK
jgi:hypothetical protein